MLTNTLQMQAGRPLPAHTAQKCHASCRTLVLCVVAAAPAAAEPQNTSFADQPAYQSWISKTANEGSQLQAADMQASRHTCLCIRSKQAPAAADRGKMPVVGNSNALQSVWSANTAASSVPQQRYLRIHTRHMCHQQVTHNMHM
jgi:hypothetical protein